MALNQRTVKIHVLKANMMIEILNEIWYNNKNGFDKRKRGSKRMEHSYKYQTYTVNVEAKRLLFVTDIHNCHFDWCNTSNQKRMELLCKCLREEYKKQPYDAILSLGDYSLDFWAWREGGSFLWETPVSNTDGFVKKYVPQMPVDFYMIPGNHEQYGNEAWSKIVGKPREYVILYGEDVFVMLDTFAGHLDPKENHDGDYTGINTDLLSQVLKDHPDKRIFLCAHDLRVPQEGESSRDLIYENRRIICAFTGHTHRDNTLPLPESWRCLPLFYCGDFSYNGKSQEIKNWGYRILDLSGEALSTEYIRV